MAISILIKAILIVIISYLLGSISFALLIGKCFYGMDIRQQGSGNLGATNAFRVLGVLPGILVFLGDVLKGVFAVGLANFFFRGAPTIFSFCLSQKTAFSHSSLVDSIIVILAGFAVVAGHNWPVFLKFSGGKGIATSTGVLLVLAPKVTIILFLIWLVILTLTKYVSLGSVVIAVMLPFFMVSFYPGNYPYIIFSLIVSAVAIYKHRSNIKRLLKGDESKIGEES